MNDWFEDPLIWGEPHPAENFWRHISFVRDAGNIPMFLDCSIGGSWADYDNTPPFWDGHVLGSGNIGEDGMKPFCVNRHDGATNGLFADYSVRRIGADWPQWMRSFKDY
jgi:prepilin-type processing-associated H-X9-DG protein